MKVAVLGSSGQVGAYLTEYLRKKNHEVFEFDKNISEDQDLTIIPNPNLEKVIEKVDFVFFLAFDVGGSRYLKKYQNTFSFINNNSRLMVNVFDLLEKYKKNFVFASSQMSNMGYSPYGVLKRVGELYTKTLGGLIIKFWNVYGFERDMDKAHVITDFIKKGFEQIEFQMLTDGVEKRQFLYAEDCCKALEVMMNSYNEFNSEDNLHITSFEYVQIKQIAEIIEKLFISIGKEIKIHPGLEKDSVQMDKQNEPDKYITKWWKPQTSIEKGIENVFNDMKPNF